MKLSTGSSNYPVNYGLGGNLAEHFYKAYHDQASKIAFVPSREEALLKAAEILVDRTGLAEASFIGPEAVVEYYNDTHESNFTPGSLIRSSVAEPLALKLLNGCFVEIDDIEDFFTHKVFKEHHLPEQNYDLIKYFHKKAHGRDSREWNQRMRSLPFIYAKGKKLKSPEALCFPTMDYKNEFGQGLTLMHTEVYSHVQNDPVIREWLESLGVKEPSDDAYLENEIIGNLRNCITSTNYLSVTRFLFEKYRKGKLSAAHFKALGAIKLKTKSGLIVEAQKCYLSDQYEPRVKLENVQVEGHYVSPEYIDPTDLATDWKSFFIRLGVAQSISIVQLTASRLSGQDAIPTAYWDYVHADARQQAESRNRYPYKVDGRNWVDLSRITFSEYAKKPAFAKEYWNIVLTEIECGGIHPMADLHWSHFEGTPPWYVPNYLPWSFKNEAIFPTTTGGCRLAKDVFVNQQEIVDIAADALPIFDCPVTVTQDWLDLIPFKTKLELDDLLIVLENLANQSVEPKDRKERDHRLGLLYMKLAAELPHYPQSARTKLKEWGRSNLLLAADGEFVPAEKLRWVKNSKRMPKGRIRSLYIPEDCLTDAGFEQLLRELGVNIIDTFSVKADDKREDSELKQRLIALVPFMALVAFKKQTEDLSEVTDRLAKRARELRLYQCSSVSLVFNIGGEVEAGESMRCHRDGGSVYYAGFWSDKSVVYELVPELARALGIPKLDLDLMRLLDSNLDEIEVFLDELGADTSLLPEGMLQSAILELAQDDDEGNIPTSSKKHLSQAAKYEANREAREAGFAWLMKNGYDTSKVDAQHSVINGVTKDEVEYPLVIKSYRNSSYKFNIRPNEWAQLDKKNALFLVFRGADQVDVLQLDDLLEANKEFHVQFETAQFERDGMANFAKAFRYVRNVHFQLDAPNFRMADALKEYRFNVRKDEKLERGNDSDKLLH